MGLPFTADAHAAVADGTLTVTDRAWTHETLRPIRDHPGVVSTRLAEMVGRERMPFKTVVRTLEALGLTESLEIGYRLSVAGAVFLERRD
jgi:hypothetical protein